MSEIKYPEQIDNDLSLPVALDGVTEINANLFNLLREAIIKVEQAIGRNPAGTLSSLSERLSSILEDNGTLKASALIAAGLISLPITNEQISSLAAISESKLDLDYATEFLFEAIESSNSEIDNISNRLSNLVFKFNNHISGVSNNHYTDSIFVEDGYLAELNNPSTLLDALTSIVQNLFDHFNATSAHDADQISVVNNFTSISATNVQDALEAIDRKQNDDSVIHQDTFHSNGFFIWHNSNANYNSNNLKYPASGVAFASISVGNTSVLTLNDAVSSLNLKVGDIVVIPDGYDSVGFYSIGRIGPKAAVGNKPSLSSFQIETFEGLDNIYDGGTFQIEIYGSASVSTLKMNAAAAIRQRTTSSVDSIQLIRPNAAKVLSLGCAPHLLSSTDSITIELGVGESLSRSVTISNFLLDRFGNSLTTTTLDKVVGRINSVLHSASGGAYPLVAFSCGDELGLAHTWQGNSNYYLKITDSSFNLGFDGYGSGDELLTIYPTNSESFAVGGKTFTDYLSVIEEDVSLAGATITFPSSANLLDLNVKIGNLVHVVSSSTTANLGTYLITGLSTTSITVHKTAGFTADSSARVEICKDSISLHEIVNDSEFSCIETFLNVKGEPLYNQRVSYNSPSSNFYITDISDDFPEITDTFSITNDGYNVTLQIGSGRQTILPLDYTGFADVYSGSNLGNLTCYIGEELDSASFTLNVFAHISEEDYLSLYNCSFNGISTVNTLVDKRLFSNVGVDELRDDAIRVLSEDPIADIYGNGFINGFDILSSGEVDTALYPLNEGLVVSGGTAYVNGARFSLPNSTVIFPNVSGTYLVYLTEFGKISISSSLDLDGARYSKILPIALVVHDGSSITSIKDQRLFIGNTNYKLAASLDLADDSYKGSFKDIKSFESFLGVENLRRIYLTSKTNDSVTISQKLYFGIDGYCGTLNVTNNAAVEGFGSGTDKDITTLLNITSARAQISNIYAEALNITAQTDGFYRFENCRFGGAIVSNLTNAKELQFINCQFDSTFGFDDNGTISTVIMQNCIFNGDVEHGAAMIEYRDCSFFCGTIISNCNSSSLVKFDNCYFEGLLSYYGEEQIQVTNCTFVDSTCGTDNLIDNSNPFSFISKCRFWDIELTVSGTKIINFYNQVKDCVFEYVTVLSTAAVACGEFIGCEILTTSGDFCIEAVYVKNNKRIASILPSVSHPLLECSGNIFDDSAVIGYNIGLLGGVSFITNNRFENIQTACSGIWTNHSECQATITNNYFYGPSDATAILIDAIQNATISGNFTKDIVAITTNGTVSNLIIEGNSLLGADSTLDGYRNISFTNNNISGDFTFSSGLEESVVSHNFGDGYIYFGGMTDININNNSINLSLGQSCSFITITNNNCNLIDCSAALNLQKSVITNNTMCFSNFGNMTLSNTIIQGNYFKNTDDFQLTLFTDGSFTPCLVDFSNNLFARTLSSFTVYGASGIYGLKFSENRFSTITTLISTADLNNSEIARNYNLGFNLSGGLIKSKIFGNIAEGADGYISGSNNSFEITSNSFSNLILNGVFVSGQISANTIYSDLSLLNDGAAIGTVFNCSISSNTVIGNINIMQNGIDTSNYSFMNNSIIKNFCNQLLLNTDGYSSAGITTTFSDNIFDGNNGQDGYLNNYDQIYYSATSGSTTRNKIINNTFARFYICGSSSAGEQVTHTDLVVSGNIFENLKFAGLQDLYGCTIQSNIVTADFTMAYNAANSSTVSWSKLNIANNQLEDIDIALTKESSATGVTFELSDSFIQNNITRRVLIENDNADSDVSHKANVSLLRNSIYNNIFKSSSSTPIPGITLRKRGTAGTSKDYFISGTIISNNNGNSANDFSILLEQTTGSFAAGGNFIISESSICNNQNLKEISYRRDSTSHVLDGYFLCSKLNIGSNTFSSTTNGLSFQASGLGTGSIIIDGLMVNNNFSGKYTIPDTAADVRNVQIINNNKTGKITVSAKDSGILSAIDIVSNLTDSQDIDLGTTSNSSVTSTKVKILNNNSNSINVYANNLVVRAVISNNIMENDLNIACDGIISGTIIANNVISDDFIVAGTSVWFNDGYSNICNNSWGGVWTGIASFNTSTLATNRAAFCFGNFGAIGSNVTVSGSTGRTIANSNGVINTP